MGASPETGFREHPSVWQEERKKVCAIIQLERSAPD